MPSSVGLKTIFGMPLPAAVGAPATTRFTGELPGRADMEEKHA